MTFSLEKWYFDTLSPKKDFIFFYFASTKILGHFEGRLNLYVIPYDTENILHRSSNFNFKRDDLYFDQGLIKTKGCSLDFSDKSCKVTLHFNRDSVDLLYKFNLNKTKTKMPLIIKSKHSHTIKWYPISIKSIVTGKIIIDEREFNIDDYNGYVDHVYSDVFPVRVPIKALYWGRIHHPQCDLTYTYIEALRNNVTYSQMIICHHNEIIRLNDMSITIGMLKYSERLDLVYPTSLKIYGNKSGFNLEIEVEHVKNAIESEFLDQQNVQSGIKRSIFQMLSRNPRGIKFIAKANLKIKHKNKELEINDAPFISEFVYFGRGNS